jgi:hypothetical protein
MGGGWQTLVALSALSGIFVGSDYFIPDGYVSIAAPVCSGLTAEGCSLRWQQVATDDGGSVAQCVQYCPRARAAVATATAVSALAQTPPAAPGCDLEIFAGPNLASTSARTMQDQPDLTPSGWDKEISSIRVIAGTWDFFSDQQYGGDVMRLDPGSYGMLDANWSKQISSFMCAQSPQ